MDTFPIPASSNAARGLELEQLAGRTGGHSNIEGFFEQFNGSLSGAVAGNQEIDFKCL